MKEDNNDITIDNNNTKLAIYTALFIALISVGAFIAIPIGPVPIVLQNMFVLLTGLILPPAWAAGCLVIYLLMGFAGLPIFAGGTSGIGKVLGPTGGYLIAYLPAAFIVSIISSSSTKRSIARDSVAVLIGTIIIYVVGIPWLKCVLGLTWGKTLAVGFYPFIIGVIIKMIAAVLIAKKLRPIVKF